MKRPEKLLHVGFFLITFIWLSTVVFYQVFSDFGAASLKRLRYQPLTLVDPVVLVDENQIKVICGPVCFFEIGGKRISTRTDSDAGGGLLAVNLRFFDPYHGLIGYEDDQTNPNFFVIDTRGEFLQVVRMKLPQISFTFEAYYPEKQLIRFSADNGQQYFYSANKPELIIL